MKKFLQNHKPSIQYIKGDVHSKDAFEVRNSVFGLPVESYDPSESYDDEPVEIAPPWCISLSRMFQPSS